jgi:hypothetical protein
MQCLQEMARYTRRGQYCALYERDLLLTIREDSGPHGRGQQDQWSRMAVRGKCSPSLQSVTSSRLIRVVAAHDHNVTSSHVARRLFNLHTRVIRPAEYHERWSHWRRRRQAAARKSHYARRLRHHKSPL